MYSFEKITDWNVQLHKVPTFTKCQLKYDKQKLSDFT